MKYKIKNICTNIFSGGTPSTSNKEFWNGNNNWLSSGETRNSYIKTTEKHISDNAVKESSTKLSIPGDLLVASAGQGFTRGQVSYNCINTYINQSLICIRTDENVVISKYLFFLLKSKYNELRQLSDSNSIRGSITTKLIGDYFVDIPKLETQQHIVDIMRYSLWIKYYLKKNAYWKQEN